MEIGDQSLIKVRITELCRYCSVAEKCEQVMLPQIDYGVEL